MKTLLKLLILSLPLTQVHATILIGGDDFNDNLVAPSWTKTWDSPAISFTEIDQRLEITNIGTGGYEGWNWTGDALSAEEDWAVLIDFAYFIDPYMLTEDQEADVQLNLETGGLHAFQMKFIAEENGFYLLTQYGNIVTDQGFGLDWRNITNNQLTVRIAYDAAADTLNASYNQGDGFETTTNYSISSWGLTPGSTFEVAIGIDAGDIPFSAGEAYFDNLLIYDGVDTAPGPDNEFDDFNDNLVDPAKWKPLFQEGAAAYTEINQRLEFTSPDTENSFIEGVWNGNMLSYTQDWSVAVDVAILYDALELIGKDIQIGLAVLEGSGYWFNLDFNIDEYGPSIGTYAGDPYDNDLFNAWGGFVLTNELILKISFDSATKELISSYSYDGGFISLTNFATSSFGLNDSSVFSPSLLVEGGEVAVPSGKVYFDNFKITRGSTFVDDDGDGLPDEWEIQYWGSIEHPDANADADPDADGNGYGGPGRNWAEWVMGTDPANANSILKLAQPRVIPGEGYVIDWQSVSGRVYTIEWTDHLTNSFQTLETGITHPQNSYTDTVHTAEDGGFYNLKVELD